MIEQQLHEWLEQIDRCNKAADYRNPEEVRTMFNELRRLLIEALCPQICEAARARLNERFRVLEMEKGGGRYYVCKTCYQVADPQNHACGDGA